MGRQACDQLNAVDTQGQDRNMSEQIARELGEISATLKSIKEGQERQQKTLDTMDGRLRKVEVKSAINGAVSGGVMAVVIGIIKDTFKV